MDVTIKLFASLAEAEGWRERACEFPVGSTVLQAWLCVTGKPAPPSRVLCAVNMHYCDQATVLKDGDELAFFPPVTGG